MESLSKRDIAMARLLLRKLKAQVKLHPVFIRRPASSAKEGRTGNSPESVGGRGYWFTEVYEII